MRYGWEGELIRLVPPDKDKHFEKALRWVNDPVTTADISIGDFPLARTAHEESWKTRGPEVSDKEVSFAIELLNGEHIGFAGVNGINWRDQSASTGTLIGADYWDRGYGTDVARVRAKYCFEVLGLRYLMSEVLEGNERSLKMLQNVGYVQCGRYPKRVWKRGNFRDQILLYLGVRR